MNYWIYWIYGTDLFDGKEFAIDGATQYICHGGQEIKELKTKLDSVINATWNIAQERTCTVCVIFILGFDYAFTNYSLTYNPRNSTPILDFHPSAQDSWVATPKGDKDSHNIYYNMI